VEKNTKKLLPVCRKSKSLYLYDIYGELGLSEGAEKHHG